jgi:hypothetical protein
MLFIRICARVWLSNSFRRYMCLLQRVFPAVGSTISWTEAMGSIDGGTVPLDRMADMALINFLVPWHWGGGPSWKQLKARPCIEIWHANTHGRSPVRSCTWDRRHEGKSIRKQNWILLPRPCAYGMCFPLWLRNSSVAKGRNLAGIANWAHCQELLAVHRSQPENYA